jgi:hypothetical protein
MRADDARLDGNAAAGLLATIFAPEMTLAPTLCDGCGAERQVGELAVYPHAMRLVIRCLGVAREHTW